VRARRRRPRAVCPVLPSCRGRPALGRRPPSTLSAARRVWRANISGGREKGGWGERWSRDALAWIEATPGIVTRYGALDEITALASSSPDSPFVVPHRRCHVGFDVVEYNASDTRSRKALLDQLPALCGNTTMPQYFKQVCWPMNGEARGWVCRRAG